MNNIRFMLSIIVPLVIGSFFFYCMSYVPFLHIEIQHYHLAFLLVSMTTFSTIGFVFLYYSFYGKIRFFQYKGAEYLVGLVISTILLFTIDYFLNGISISWYIKWLIIAQMTIGYGEDPNYIRSLKRKMKKGGQE